MDIIEYAPLAMRTAKVMDDRDMLVHGALGVCTEAGEFAMTASNFLNYGGLLDRANVMEELGDGAWFTVYVLLSMGIDVPQINFELLKGTVVSAVETNHIDHLSVGVEALAYAAAAEKIGTPVKAHAFYGKDLDRAGVTLACVEVLRQIYKLCLVTGVDFSEMLEGNIAKLKKRYPNKYSDEDALARADKQAAWPFPKMEVKNV